MTDVNHLTLKPRFVMQSQSRNLAYVTNSIALKSPKSD